MGSALQFELLDLRHFSAGSLRPLLDEESRIWSERLHWDYRGSADLLLQYLDSRVLPGYVAVDNGRIVGYVFCVYEGRKAVIGDVFALDARDSATEIRNELLVRLFEMLKKLARRIAHRIAAFASSSRRASASLRGRWI